MESLPSQMQVALQNPSESWKENGIRAVEILRSMPVDAHGKYYLSKVLYTLYMKKLEEAKHNVYFLQEFMVEDGLDMAEKFDDDFPKMRNRIDKMPEPHYSELQERAANRIRGLWGDHSYTDHPFYYDRHAETIRSNDELEALCKVAEKVSEKDAKVLVIRAAHQRLTSGGQDQDTTRAISKADWDLVRSGGLSRTPITAKELRELRRRGWSVKNGFLVKASGRPSATSSLPSSVIPKVTLGLSSDDGDKGNADDNDEEESIAFAAARKRKRYNL